MNFRWIAIAVIGVATIVGSSTGCHRRERESANNQLAETVAARSIPSTDLSIKAKAFWKLDHVDPAGPEFYFIEATIKNIGRSPIAFDMVEGTFVGPHGASWATRAYNVKRENGFKPATTLQPQESNVFEFSTTGHEYLHFNEGEFRITLFLKDRTVAGPFRSTLPPLQTLPFEYVQDGKDAAGRNITNKFLVFADSAGIVIN